MSLNTDSSLKAANAIQYLIQNAGFHYSETDKTTDYVFSNNLKKSALLNLSGRDGSGSLSNIRVAVATDNNSLPLSMNPVTNALKVNDTSLTFGPDEYTDSVKVYVANPSGGGGGGDVNVTNTSLDVHCYGNDGTDFQLLRTDTDGSVFVNLAGDPNLGTVGNVHTTTLAGGAISTPLNIDNTYLNNSVLTYEDTNTTITTAINLLASRDSTNYAVIGTLQPANTVSGKRTASTVLRLKAFTYFSIQNLNPSVTLTSVVCSLFSS
jgi:hypothetical protein